MDCEPEELQFLGLIGICREASKLIVSWRRLFSQISSSLIVPLSILFLAHIQISHFLFSQIDRNENALEHTAAGSPSERRLLHRISSEWSAFLLFKALYLVALLIFSLLSTAAVVYTIASAYTAKHDLLLSYRKVLSVVPKVWRRLAHTFLFAFLILLAYNIVVILVFVFVIILAGNSVAGIICAIAIFLAYLAGLVWISVVWHVASVVSVLEDARGAAAMARSRELVRGKMWLAAFIFVMMNMAFLGIELAFRQLVVVGALPAVGRLGLAVAMLALLSVVVLFALVVQTVVYFVCKSYHHESIDKSALADHLEVYLGEYMPLKERDVQMEQLRV
ncbi:hypothetical protein HPP92_024903 [Vanilla planifolia]|uniref:Uncharacterized protein n=1 Tax=Vanilla planifolia TaxID=51239 RepID=A0A835PJ25_VANPL|nr:hypothetical protein HPP92_025186 [Vanilla planifolia]KAG0453599.1 hypothetical protein HPP92_024903 [Vanilla planifolia]